MRLAMKSAICLAVLAGVFFIHPAAAAIGTELDGTWSVVVITEKGDCDRAYRYAVKVANGRVSYQGDAAVDMAGTVTPNGAVTVHIRLGDKGADGIGHLSGQTGAGTWHGAGSTGTCGGRWEAERR